MSNDPIDPSAPRGIAGPFAFPTSPYRPAEPVQVPEAPKPAEGPLSAEAILYARLIVGAGLTALVLLVAAVALVVLGVWTGDGRWLATGGLGLLLTAAALYVALRAATQHDRAKAVNVAAQSLKLDTTGRR
jgi:uncharacterized membrane protein